MTDYSAVELTQSACYVNSSSMTYNVTNYVASTVSSALADFYPTSSFLYTGIEPGDIIYRTFTGYWQTSSAVDEDKVEALAVVESVTGDTAKIIYYGEIIFPTTYSLSPGVVYYVATSMSA